MNKKMFSIILILSLFLISICSFSFAATEALNSTKNAVMNVGNAIGNGVKDVANGAANLGKDAVNTTQAAGNSIAGATSMNNDGMDYTATRTSADNNVMGLSSDAPRRCSNPSYPHSCARPRREAVRCSRQGCRLCAGSRRRRCSFPEAGRRVRRRSPRSGRRAAHALPSPCRSLSP